MGADDWWRRQGLRGAFGAWEQQNWRSHYRFLNFEALKERNERPNMARNDRDAGCYEALKERHPHERTAMPLEDRDARGWRLVKVCGMEPW